MEEELAEELPEDSFHKTLDAAIRRVITCVGCKSENVSGNWDHNKLWRGYCITCGLRFWHQHHPH